jgi:hypothetical protein
VPNPASEQLQLQVSSEHPGQLSIRFFDMTGRMVHEKEEQVSTGENAITINSIAKWPSGMYIVAVFQGGEKVFASRVYVNKD